MIRRGARAAKQPAFKKKSGRGAVLTGGDIRFGFLGGCLGLLFAFLFLLLSGDASSAAYTGVQVQYSIWIWTGLAKYLHSTNVVMVALGGCLLQHLSGWNVVAWHNTYKRLQLH